MRAELVSVGSAVLGVALSVVLVRNLLRRSDRHYRKQSDLFNRKLAEDERRAELAGPRQATPDEQSWTPDPGAWDRLENEPPPDE